MAADSTGFSLWTAKQFKAYEKSLAPKIDARKTASEPFGKFGNHTFQIIRRGGNGEAELHEM